MKKITVFISDDHAIEREGLRLQLEAADDIEAVGEAGNGQVVSETKRLRPDVVLMDIAMPLLNGMDAARRIAQEVPATRVLILSSYSDDRHVRLAIEAGAVGYLMKESASRDLLQAIRDVAKGNAFFSPPIARCLLRQWHNRNPLARSSAPSALTNRQMEVIQLIAEGYSSKQIAGLLSVSIKTVEKHRQALMDKLDIHEIASLTRYAVSNGIVDPDHTPYQPVAQTAQVKSSLMAHRSTSSIKTTAHTTDGVVTISGIAKNPAEKSLVTKLATDTSGVGSVINT
jgi:DNA-binding NarL/FixJ family response regulator